MCGSNRARIGVIILVLASLLAVPSLVGQEFDKALFNGLKWRLVGPFRGGRVEAVAGLSDEPNVYYFGAVAGGVWKTADSGISWKPIFDHESNLSIGAIVIAPSNRNVIYVGMGEPCLRNEITFGNGMYRSTDGGATWTHIGLTDTQHIAKILVDPANPEIVLVAAVGHASGPNAERGVFRSEDGGKTWNKVLYKDENTGAVDLVMDPTNSRIFYAALYQAGSINPAMMVAHGHTLRIMVYRTECSAESVLQSQRTACGCMRSLKRRKRGACTALTTTARTGNL